MIGISELASSYLDKTEYDRVIITIRNLVRLSQIANRRGMLSLDNLIPDLEPFLLRKGIELITEGCYYLETRIIMDNLIDSSNHEGAELLEQLIIREGVLLIQAGYRPKQLLDTISSLLGEDFCKSIEHLDLLKEDETLDLIEEEPHDAVAGADLLENILININQNEEMEKLIRKVGTLQMALALIGVSSNTFKHISNHISSDTQDEIRSLMKKIAAVRLIDVQEAQKWIIAAHRNY